MNIHITTYRLTPYLPLDRKTVTDTGLIREITSKLIRAGRNAPGIKEVDVSLFYNHGADGKNRVGYPLIIYHDFGSHYCITGINEGAVALSALAGLYKRSFRSGSFLFPGFKKEEETEVEPKICPGSDFRYRLIKWMPVHHNDFSRFARMSYAEKVSQLNLKLLKHIESELNRDLKLGLENPETEITDVLSAYPEPVNYKGYKYPVYDIEFCSNAVLSRWLTLGNNKSLGFGRIEPL